MPAKEVLPGTIRIKADLTIVQKTKSGWKQVSKAFPNALQVIKLFQANNNFEALLDTKNPEFLKGQLSPDNKAQGARITILPTGEKLDKAFSLFSPELTIHDQTTHDHWDVIYKNPGGTYAYVYTLEKRQAHKKSKFRKVDNFKKHYPTIQKQTSKALENHEDKLALPMYTLLQTYMRVGNEIYFKTHGHKGLTTLQKQDISINHNEVTFDFIAKDGVPVTIVENFPNNYITRLQKLLSNKALNQFVFANDHNHPYSDMQFKEAFKRYCGEEFYPHIVRSFYATTELEQFLEHNESFTKKELQSEFAKIAHKLGHKKFDKKTQTWKDSYNVTLNHYIQPELVEKAKSLAK